MHRLRIVGLVLMSLLITSGGAAAGPAGYEKDQSLRTPLSGTSWLLVALPGYDSRPGSQVTLRFEADGRLSGSDGCNRYRGGYTADGSGLDISDDMITTRMACPEQVMGRASAYAEALGQAASIAIDGDRLSLRNAAGKEVAAFVADSRGLAGTAWQVLAYNNGRQAVVSVLGGTGITARFGEDGRVTGSAGCNEYFAAYETANDSITIGSPGATRRFCAEPEGVMDQEARFLDALPTAASFRLEGERLALRTAGGSLVATFVEDAPVPLTAGSVPRPKIRFDLDRLNADGLQGPPDGLRSLHYEYCIPDRGDAIDEVTAIDPTLSIQQGSPGRVGCGDGELLCLGDTHQPDHRTILERLSALPFVREIHEAFFE